MSYRSKKKASIPIGNTEKTIFFLTFFDIFSYAAISPFFALLILDTPYSITQQTPYSKHILLGGLFSLFACLQVIFLPLWSKLSQKIGKRRSLVMANLFSSLTYLISAFAVWYSNLNLLFLATGIAGMTSANVVLSHAIMAVNSKDPQDTAGRYSAIGSIIGLAFLIAPVLARVALNHFPTPSLPGVIYVFCTSTSLLNAYICYKFLPKSLDKLSSTSAHVPFLSKPSKPDSNIAFKELAPQLFVQFCCFCGWYTFLKFFQVFLIEGVDISPEDSITWLSFLGFSCTFWQGLRASYTNLRMPLGGSLHYSLLFMTLCIISIIYLKKPLYICLNVFLIGLSYTGIMPSIYARWMDEHRISAEIKSGIFQSCQAVAKVASPLIAGSLSNLSPFFPSIFAACCFTLAFSITTQFKTEKTTPIEV